MRVCWYTMESVLEDPNIRELGVIFLIFPYNMPREKIDISLWGKIIKLETDFLPLKWRSMHFCRPSAFYPTVGPFFKSFMGKRLRIRFCVHSGDEEDVLEKLSVFGLARDCVPSDLGGKVVLDHMKWVSDRFFKENKLCQNYLTQERANKDSCRLVEISSGAKHTFPRLKVREGTENIANIPQYNHNTGAGIWPYKISNPLVFYTQQLPPTLNKVEIEAIGRERALKRTRVRTQPSAEFLRTNERSKCPWRRRMGLMIGIQMRIMIKLRRTKWRYQHRFSTPDK